MTVRELIEELEDYDGNMRVVIRGCNSGGYVDSTKYVSRTEVTSFWGNDYDAVLIGGGEQLGMGS